MADIASTAQLQAGQPLLTAASKVLLYLWDTAWAEAPGTLAGDADALHDMRVAMRRLRTAMQNFEGTVEAPFVPPHLCLELAHQRRKLGKLGDALGAVRDFDVLGDDVKDYKDTHLKPSSDKAGRVSKTSAKVSGLDKLQEFLKSEREAAFPFMVEQLNKDMEPAGRREKFARFALGLPAIEMPLLFGGAAPLILSRRVAETLQAAPFLHDDGEVLGHHEFRKSLRRLRYSLEMLSPCLAYPVARHIKRLTELQDLLGEMQDNQVLCEATHDAFGVEGAIHFKRVKDAVGQKGKTAPDAYKIAHARKLDLPPDVREFLIYGESRRHELLQQARDLWDKQQQRNWPQSLIKDLNTNEHECLGNNCEP